MEAPTHTVEEDPIRCCVRIRPLNRSEKNRAPTTATGQNGANQVCLSALKDNQTLQYFNHLATVPKGSSRTNSASKIKKKTSYATKNNNHSSHSAPHTPTDKKTFTFDVVLSEKMTQEDVFEKSGIRELIDFALEGFSTTIFAYGQTGSGKTFTISGEDSDSQLRGILPRCGEYLFKQIQRLSRESIHQSFHCKYKVRVSYLEIWNEHINDLLNLESTNLPVRWSNQEGFFVENLYVIQCEDLEDYMVILNEGVSNRRVASHDLNVDSSRSHSIFTVYIDIEYTDDSEMAVAKRGKIQIVDLAGSERLKESNSSGGTAVETGHINKSLLTLGKVINVLSDPRKTGDNSYVPYRDSKLTMLLMDSIGGSSKTVMIACVTPSVLYTEETYNTLLYAKRVKNIKNKPIINIDPHEAYVLELKGQIKSLQEELAHTRTSREVASSSETHNNPWRNHEERTEAPPSYFESIQNDRVPPLTITRTQDEGLRLPPIGKKTYYPEPSSPLPREIDVQTDRRKARMYGKMGETYCHDSLEREPFPVLKHSTHTDPQYMDFLTVKMRMEEEIQNLRNTVHSHKSKGYISDDSRFSSARSSRSHVSYPGSESNAEVKHEEQMKKEIMMLRNENLTLRRLCYEQGITIPSDLTLVVDSDVKQVSQPAEKLNDHQQQSDIASARKKPERPRPRKQPELQPFGGINQLGRMTSGGEETNLEKHNALQSLRQTQALPHEREPARDTIEDRKRSPSSAGSSRSQRSHSAASSLHVETKTVRTPADLIPTQEDSATNNEKEEPQDSENGLKSEEEGYCSSNELVTPLDTNSPTEEPSRPPPPSHSEVMEL